MKTKMFVGKKIGKNILPIFFTLLSVIGLAQTKDSPMKIEIWGKFWNSAFVDEYAGKLVEIDAKWIGVATSLMDVVAADKPYNGGKWVQVGITQIGDKISSESFNQYPNQCWKVFIRKELSDKAFQIESGSNVKVTGIAQKRKDALGKFVIALEIETIEPLGEK